MNALAQPKVGVESLIKQVLDKPKITDSRPKIQDLDKQDKLQAEKYMKTQQDAAFLNQTLAVVAPEQAVKPGEASNKLSDKKAEYVNARAKLEFTRADDNDLVKTFFAGAEPMFKAIGLKWELIMAGVPANEISRLEAKAKENAGQQNEQQVAANLETIETLYIAGGSPKRVKAQVRLADQVLAKLIRVGRRLGAAYTPERLTEMKLEQCQGILARFDEERERLNGQLAMAENNVGAV